MKTRCLGLRRGFLEPPQHRANATGDASTRDTCQTVSGCTGEKSRPSAPRRGLLRDRPEHHHAVASFARGSQTGTTCRARAIAIHFASAASGCACSAPRPRSHARRVLKGRGLRAGMPQLLQLLPRSPPPLSFDAPRAHARRLWPSAPPHLCLTPIVHRFRLCHPHPHPRHRRPPQGTLCTSAYRPSVRPLSFFTAVLRC